MNGTERCTWHKPNELRQHMKFMMSKRRLLVTGSKGFVGTALTNEVRARFSDRFEYVGFMDPETDAPADLRNGDAVARAVRSAAPDAVIHLAATAAPREAKKDPVRAWEVNVLGSLHLTKALMQHAPNAVFVWSGSSEAYGRSFDRSDAPICEEQPLEPISPYGATKAATDIMLRQMARDGLRATIFRPFNHSGPGQSADYVVSSFAYQIACIEAGIQDSVLKVGNLEAERDFLDVRDVVNAYVTAALNTKDLHGEAYNLATGQPIRIHQILEKLISLAKCKITVEQDPERYVPSDIPKASGNPSKALTELGWKPSIPLETTLSDVLEYWRQHVPPHQC